MSDHDLPPVEDFPDWRAELTPLTSTDVMRWMVYRDPHTQSRPSADSTEDIQAKLLQWTGTESTFRDWILQVWRNGKLKATTEPDILNQAAEHFVWNGKTQPGTSGAQKLVWMGTLRELTEWFLGAYRAGHIEASSNMNALNQAVTHFVSKSGRALNARSLWQNLKNRDEYKRKPDPLA